MLSYGTESDDHARLSGAICQPGGITSGLPVTYTTGTPSFEIAQISVFEQ
jgi:hypothetical protein